MKKKNVVMGLALASVLFLASCGNEEQQTSVASPIEQASSAEVARAEKADKLDEVEDVSPETIEEIKNINDHSQLPVMLLDTVDLPGDASQYDTDNPYVDSESMEGITATYLPDGEEVTRGQLVQIDIASESYSVYGLYVGFGYQETVSTLESLGYQRVKEEDGLDFFEKDGVTFVLGAGENLESISLRLGEND